ncbi:TetR/AcrR family transcriptional regulator [Actinosynnema sp. NPDC091369]
MVGSTRQHILDVTADLLRDVDIEAVSIRDVCQAAGITAPTLYHHFGDKRGLLEAVAAEGFARYLAEKHGRGPSEDPFEDLKAGWDSHVRFGLTNPAFYVLMYGGTRAHEHPSAREGLRVLHDMLVRLAERGRLLVTPEEAVPTIHSACVGTTLTLVADPDAPAHAGLSHRVRDAVLAAVVKPEHPTGQGTEALPDTARALLATLGGNRESPLSPGERLLLTELLTRLASPSPGRGPSD